MDGFEQRKLRKMRNITQAALELFLKFGVGKVSVSEIAEKANVSQVTIYKYFGTKDGLLKHVIEEFLEQNLKKYERILESYLPFHKKIEKMMFGAAESDKEFSRASIQSDFFDDPMIKEFIDQFYTEKTLPFFYKLIEQGQQEGYVDPNISTEAVLFYINMFKEAVTRPEFKSIDNSKLRSDINKLFYYGLNGQKISSF